jgi:hypothetical protein
LPAAAAIVHGRLTFLGLARAHCVELADLDQVVRLRDSENP